MEGCSRCCCLASLPDHERVAVEETGSAEVALEREEELREANEHRLVEAVARDERGTVVRPAPVHQQQATQVHEAAEREVAGARCLQSLLANDADADVRLLDLTEAKHSADRW